jgi:hypothetical protein
VPSRPKVVPRRAIVASRDSLRCASVVPRRASWRFSGFPSLCFGCPASRHCRFSGFPSLCFGCKLPTAILTCQVGRCIVTRAYSQFPLPVRDVSLAPCAGGDDLRLSPLNSFCVRAATTVGGVGTVVRDSNFCAGVMTTSPRQDRERLSLAVQPIRRCDTTWS